MSFIDVSSAIQDNVSLNYNPVFQGKDPLILPTSSLYISSFIFMFKGICVFTYFWLHLIIYLGCLRSIGGDQANS